MRTQNLLLAVIATLLAVIAARPLIAPATTALAQGQAFTVQFSADVPSVSFFDPRSGEIWQYNATDGQLMRNLRLNKPGQPLAIQFSRK
ncbi:MAG TPA: hypothetical protein VFC21_01085 [Bryobacteraceae bacterium]|nr:hypothetical protein [Bryobacteraceae bacterium]